MVWSSTGGNGGGGSLVRLVLGPGVLLSSAALIAVAAMSCAGQRPLRLPPPVVARPLSGAVDYELLRDPQAPSIQVKPTQDYQPPQPHSDNALPPYPPELIVQAPPAEEVAVRAYVGTDGAVAKAVPSPLDTRPPDGLRAQFVEAALAAVRQWHFEPARIRSFGPGQDLDGNGSPDYQVLQSETPVEVFLDFRFVFTVKEGRGVVEGSATPTSGPGGVAH
jgi:hypothetical protein